ncbi:MAG: hypothetical protein OXI91_07450 [Chloroflexota bacterium]|nr:hypothetical protein [Chloroflexota bacterium]
MTGHADIATSQGVRTRQALRKLRRGLLLLSLVLLVLAVGHSDYRPTQLETAMAPHRYSILKWEVSHLSHKWIHAASTLLPGFHRLNDDEKASLVAEYFVLAQSSQRMERQLRQAEPGGRGLSAGGDISSPQGGRAYLEAAIAENRKKRQELLPHVEYIVEQTIANVAREQGLETRWLGIFPPVDTTFGESPNVLVLSPRDRIYRQDSFLLDPALNSEIKEDLETIALETANLSAIVAGTAGLSVYPSVVIDTLGLRYALEVAAHEWLHHWLFFRPLGRNFNKSPEMLTLNETAATIAGEELGDLAYASLTGDEATRPWVRAHPDGFDFSAEMRHTRLQAEQFLARGDIEGAEAFMEERRQVFVEAGYNIRKLNQAYFAFHGTYATKPGSISPIGGQMREIRRRSGSLGEFLDTVAQFGNYAEYLEYWKNLDTGAATRRPGRLTGGPAK